MAKAKTSTKPIKYLKEIGKLNPKAKIEQWDENKRLLNKDFLGKAILECLLNNDPEGVMEVVSIYLDTLNKVKLSKRAKVPRATLYHSMKNKNPTIKTLAKIVHTSTSNELKKNMNTKNQKI